MSSRSLAFFRRVDRLREWGFTTRQASALALCHRRIHSRVTWATEQGFIVSATDDPATVPMLLRCETPRLLTATGEYREVAS